VTDELGYRAELANQVLVRLSRFQESEWRDILSRASEVGEYVSLAHELALYALDLFEEEFGEDARRLVDRRLQDAADLFPSTPAETEICQVSRQILAEGVLLSVLLRGSPGFNHGAYRELTLPFSGVLDLDDVERQARMSVQPGLTDYSAVAPPTPAREGEPRSKPKSA
jgi:hypothetical protein